jgi:translation initiation factor 3 subunit E
MAETNGANGATNIVEQYDLLPKMIPYLDKHMLFPLVVDRSQGSDDKDNLKVQYVLLKDTNMTDYVADLDQQLRGLSEKPAEYTKKREEVLKKRDAFEEETATIRGLLEDADVVGNLRSDKVANLAYLKEQHGVTPEMVNQLYEYGQFEYSCGSYQSAGELLYQFRVLVSLFRYSPVYWT